VEKDQLVHDAAQLHREQTAMPLAVGDVVMS
jgi:hypothetical protein